eukprot:TRINITY_DN61181_c0_g1_i1.p1 TRINITY_DN61181_c0_g1~~TRINITY_DN61181_c0_g1_i1.p1  ORF type:complete len:282 (+),score=66.88 TRINITY_DN61181_c0_g1_i1:39-848(+)
MPLPRARNSQRALLPAIGMAAAAILLVCSEAPAFGPGASAGAGNPAQHAEAAKAQMRQIQMPQAPDDPLEWSVDQVRGAGFMESATYAGSLCRALENGQEGEEISERLRAMLSHSDGARGFFVTYLTDPTLETIADASDGLPMLVSDALKASDMSTVAPLAVMNVAMPTATALSHKASGDETSAQNSARTARRGGRVLQLLAADSVTLPIVTEKLKACLLAVEAWPEDGNGVDKEWATFLRRWKYDAAQVAAIREALASALGTTVQAVG